MVSIAEPEPEVHLAGNHGDHMHRTVSFCLMVHWAVIFSAMALSGAALVGGAADGPGIVGVSLQMTVGALFAWAALGQAAARGSDAFDPAAIAVAGAVLLVAAGAGAGAFTASGSGLTEAGVHLAALAVTYLVVATGAEPARAPEQVARPDRSRSIAQRKAIEAAHGSMLQKISGRRSLATEADA